jgi:transposase-like protein
MSTADLTAPQFTDETAAREHLEALRWPDGVFCPHCGSFEGITKMQGKSHRPGLFLCGGCRGNFSVTVGTVYERSHIPLHKWLLATHLLASSKKGISAHQLHRMLGITYKSAWFMCHRIREAMDDKTPTPMGGEGKTVEVDETYIGQKANHTKDSGAHHKMTVVTLVERGGRARSFKVDKATARDIVPIVRANVDKASKFMTDEARWYWKVGTDFEAHGRVAHKRGEYGRGDVHTNTVEGYYSVFKRGMKGVYQHCSERHLQRYLAEFDFRYSNRAKLGVSDAERAEKALKGIEGKRLTYRRTDKRPEAPSLG